MVKGEAPSLIHSPASLFGTTTCREPRSICRSLVLRSWPVRTEAMQDAVSVLLRIYLPRTSVNKVKEKDRSLER